MPNTSTENMVNYWKYSSDMGMQTTSSMILSMLSSTCDIMLIADVLFPLNITDVFPGLNAVLLAPLSNTLYTFNI